MNVFDLAASISLDTSKYEKGLKDASKKSESAFSKILGNAGKMLANLGKLSVTALTAASTAVVAIGKSSISAYADYEQYIGGIEKLYGENARQLIEMANDSYKTTGMSANQYLQTVTTFSASLIKSLGGDTKSAMVMADTAMQDMADNAAIFGTDIDRVQAAYAGFAKGNFTMLDNLNLGYGGTKEGMEQLIAKANELRKAQGLSANLSINSFADIVEAIHLVQQEMKITGRAGEEGAKTLSGSFKRMKAAWENFMISLSDRDEYQMLSEQDLVDAVKTWWGNMRPAIERFSQGFGQFVERIAPIVADELPNMLGESLPPLIKAASKMLVAIGKSLPKLAKKVLPSVINGVIDVVNGLLGTKIPHIDEIRFPTWPEVQAAATKAWETIQEGFKSIAKLILGDDFKADDSWITVGSKIWEKIKSGIKLAGESLKKLILGENYTAESSWGDVGVAIRDAIKEKLSFAGESLKKLILGESYTPESSWSDVGTAIWGAIKAGLYIAGESLKKLILGENYTAESSWGDVGVSIRDAIKEKFSIAGESLKKLILGDNYTAESTWGDVGASILGAIKSGLSLAGESLKRIILGDDYTAESTWSDVGKKIFAKIKEGIGTVGDLLAKLFHPDEKIDVGTGWVTVGNDIINAIGSAFDSVDDFLRRLILGKDYPGTWGDVGVKIHEAIKNLFSQPIEINDSEMGLFEHLGQMLSEKVGTIFNGIIDGLYGLLTGEAPTAEMKLGDKLGGIISGAIDRAYEAIDGLENLLFHIILGDQADSMDNPWVRVGQKISTLIKDLIDSIFSNDGTGKDSIGGKLFDLIWKGVVEAARATSGLLLGLLSGDMEKPGGGPIETWVDFFHTVFEQLYLALADFWDKFFDGAKAKWNDFATFINKKTGTDFLPVFRLREFDEDVKSVQKTLTDTFGSKAKESEIDNLVTLFETAKQSGLADDWKAFNDALDSLSGKYDLIDDESLGKVKELANALGGIEGKVKVSVGFDWNLLKMTSLYPYLGPFLTALTGFNVKKEIVHETPEEIEEAKSQLQEYIKVMEEYEQAQKELDEFRNSNEYESDEYYQDKLESLEDAAKAKAKSMYGLYDALKDTSVFKDFTNWLEENPNSSHSDYLPILEVSFEPNEDSKTVLQDACNNMDLHAMVKLVPDTSNFETDDGNIHSSSGGQFAKGLDYVPTNDFLARLHKGEAVLTASEARAWREGRYGVDTDAIVSAVTEAITTAMGNMMFVMNGREVANAVSGVMGQRIRGFQKANSAGYGR